MNPWGRFTAAWLPNWLLVRTEVSTGAKICYGRLCQFGGRGGRCIPSQHLLAKETGVGERQVRRYLEELVAAKLIGVRQRGLGRSNRYEFLEHPWMTEDPRFLRSYRECLGATRNSVSGQGRTHTSSEDRSSMSVQEQTVVSSPVTEEIQVRREGGEETHLEDPLQPPEGGRLSSTPPACITPLTIKDCRRAATRDSDVDREAAAILELYPVKAGRPTALRAIKRALRRHPLELLRRKTIEFAATVANSDLSFVPNPARFFREERFLDPPTTWTRPARPRAHIGVAPPRTFTDLNYAQSADVLRPGIQP